MHVMVAECSQPFSWRKRLLDSYILDASINNENVGQVVWL